MSQRSTNFGKLPKNLGFGSKCSSSQMEMIWYQIYGFSLKNHEVDYEVNEMFDMGAETMALPLDEKMKFEQGNDGMSFGFASWQIPSLSEYRFNKFTLGTKPQVQMRQMSTAPWTQSNSSI
jgi:hypothetical protein